MDLLALDGNILLFIQDNLRVDFLTPIMKAITLLGSFKGIFWIMICIALLVISRTRRAGVAASIALAFSGIISNAIIKNLVDRTRPYVAIDGLEPLGKIPTDPSFPSGHASAAFAVSVALCIALPWIMEKKKAHLIGVLFIVLSSLISFTRLYLGVHYPSDVLAGIILGIIYGICGGVIAKLIFKKIDERKQDQSDQSDQSDTQSE